MRRKKAEPIKPAAKAKAKAKGAPKYALRLYVTGATPRSSTAIANLRKLCEENLAGRYKLEIIDIYQRPHLAREVQIIAAPTLVKFFPLPLRRFIGDMSNKESLLSGLEVHSVVVVESNKKPRKA